MGYVYRLLCLSLASFFILHLFVGLVIKVSQGAVIRRSERMTASSAAQFLFAIRLLPAGAALLAVGLLCIPSYLWLEPRAWSEPVGFWCLLAAVLGAALWISSLSRAVHAIRQSIRFERSCRRSRLELDLAGERTTLWLTEPASPVVALAGIFRPKLLVSRQAFAALCKEELQSAIGHERAHQASHDNLKRLLLLLAPDVLPFWSAFSNYDQVWARLAEWAADDRVAVAGPEQTLSLASALVCVARLKAVTMPEPLMTSFLAEASALPARVERLLTAAPNTHPVRGRSAAAPAIAATAALFAVIAAQASTLRFVHELLEHLIR